MTILSKASNGNSGSGGSSGISQEEAFGVGGFISGLIVRNGTDSDHDINIDAGQIKKTGTDEPLYNVPAMTKQLDVAFAAGNDSGALVNGISQIPQSGFIRIDIILNDSTSTIDYCAGLNLSGASIPSGYSLVRTLTHLVTDDSRNIIPQYAIPSISGARVFVLKQYQVRNLAQSSVSPQPFTLSNVSPNGVATIPFLGVDLFANPSSNNTVYVIWAISDLTERLVLEDRSSTDVLTREEVHFPLTNDGSISVRSEASSGNHTVRIDITGWEEFI